MNIENINDLPGRIRICVGLAGNGEILAKKAAINRRTLETYISGQAEPKISKIVSIARAVGVSIDWLATGEGEMMAIEANAQKPYKGKDMPFPTLHFQDHVGHYSKQSGNAQSEGQQEWEEFTLIPIYDVEASAGNGSHVDQELQTGQIAFRKDWLQEKGLGARHLVTIKARGDSMMPTISDGDILLINICIDKIIDDSIYIVRADHHLIVKRIQQNLDGSLHIISDNKRYKEQLIQPEQAKEIKIAGRVIWYGHEI